MESSGPRILLVDSIAANLVVFEEFLHREGYVTSTAQTACVAYRLIDMERPSLLVVSIDLDWYEAGLDLIGLLRQEPTTAALPIIICTADLPGLGKHKRQLADWNCFILAQPFDEAAFLTTLQAARGSGLQSRAIGE